MSIPYNVVVLEQPVRGWGKDFSGSNSGPIETQEGGYTIGSNVSLWRPSQLGHITPGETFTSLSDASGRVDGLPINGVVTSTGEAFVYIDTARVVQFGVSDETIDGHRQVVLAGSHAAHASLSGTDCDVLGYKNATDEYVIYTYNDATDGDAGRMLKDGTSPDDDWLSTLATQTNGSALTAGVPHKAKIGPDGVIYITNGQYIASHVPTSTAVDYQKLNLGVGMVATSIEVDGNYLVIGAYRATTYITSYARSDALIFYWDTIAASYNQSFPLHDNYVSALVNKNGVIHAFTSGRNNTTKIKVREGSGFRTVFESAQIGSAPLAGSIDVFEDLIHYGSSNGKVFVLDGSAFHLRTNVTGSASVGMVKNLATNTLYVGRNVSGAYSIAKMVISGGFSSGEFRDRLRVLPYKSNIEYVVVYFSRFASTASVTFSFFKDYATVSIGGATDFLNKTIDFATYGAVSSVSFKPIKKITNVNAFYLHLSAISGDIAIRRIEVYYSPTGKTN